MPVTLFRCSGDRSGRAYPRRAKSYGSAAVDTAISPPRQGAGAAKELLIIVGAQRCRLKAMALPGSYRGLQMG